MSVNMQSCQCLDRTTFWEGSHYHMNKAYGFHMSELMSKMIIVLILLAVMNCLGCSAFGRVTSLRMDDHTASLAAATAGAEMTQIKTRRFSIPRYTGAYKYQISKASIIFCPGNQKGGQLFFVGPPLLPVIPFFVGKPDEPASDFDRKRIQYLRHSIVIGIDSRETQVELDFSALRLKLRNGAPVRIETVTVTGEMACTDDGYRLFPGRENLIDKQVVIKDSKTYHWIIFDTSLGDIDGLIIDLGPIKIEGGQIELSPIEYRKRNSYYYVPFYLPLPS